jgi:DNA repair ATPase RecN
MTDIFEEIRQQIHELRNALSPIDFKMANFEHEIEECRVFFEQKAQALEARVFANTFKLEEQNNRIVNILERLQWIEIALKVPAKPKSERPLPANGEDAIQLPS